MDEHKLEKFFQEVKPIVEENKRIRAEKEANGDFFNIFTILNMERDEVHTHSAFLAELLNPNGTHGQGNIFLEAFVKNILHLNNLETINAEIIVEYSIGPISADYKSGGRIDIFIKFRNPDYLILIENKIDAGDQPYQLYRYNNYALKSKKQYKLLYLTKDGHEPSNISIGIKTKTQYWDCISYSKTIRNWLKECLPLIKSTIVIETIKQYINLIDKITNQDMESNLKDKLLKLMLENFDETLAITDNRNILDDYLYDDFKKQMDELANEMNCKLDWKGEIWNRGNDQYIYFIPKLYPKSRIYFGKESGQEVFMSIESKNHDKVKKLNCFSEDPTDNYPYGWNWFNYKEWNTETIRAIHNGELKNYIKKWIIEILNDPNFPKK